MHKLTSIVDTLEMDCDKTPDQETADDDRNSEVCDTLTVDSRTSEPSVAEDPADKESGKVSDNLWGGRKVARERIRWGDMDDTDSDFGESLPW